MRTQLREKEVVKPRVGIRAVNAFWALLYPFHGIVWEESVLHSMVCSRCVTISIKSSNHIYVRINTTVALKDNSISIFSSVKERNIQ